MRVPLNPLFACGAALLLVSGGALGQVGCRLSGPTLINGKDYYYGKPQETITISLPPNRYLNVQCGPRQYALSGAKSRQKNIYDITIVSVESYRCGDVIYKELRVRRDCRDNFGLSGIEKDLINILYCKRGSYYNDMQFALVDRDGKEWPLGKPSSDDRSNSTTCGEWGYMSSDENIYPVLERVDVIDPKPVMGYSVRVVKTSIHPVVSVRDAEVPRF